MFRLKENRRTIRGLDSPSRSCAIRESILVVERDEIFRMDIVQGLQLSGYACRDASCPMKAIELIKEGQADILVCRFPVTDNESSDLIAEVRNILPDIAVVFIVDGSEDQLFEKLTLMGAADFFGEPLNLAEIRFKLNRLVSKCDLLEENKKLSYEHASLKEKVPKLLRVSKGLTAEIDFDRIFELIISGVTEIMDAERSTLYLIDLERHQLWTKVAEGISQIRVPIGQGISGRVAEKGQTIKIDDAWQLPYFKREFDLKHDFRTRSVLCMPVFDRKKDLIAVIQVLNKKNGRSFDKNDEYILEAVASQVATALENSFLMDELKLSFDSAILALSATVDARHPLTAGHSERVTQYSLLIAGEMGLNEDELRIIKYAALLHDIGKIGISDRVLLKQGAFTSDERDEMNTHPLRTRQILEKFRFPKSLAPVPLIASQHHERVNGKGYPEGLTGDELPLGSKIIAVADVFDALTSKRDYPKYCGTETLNSDPLPLSKVIRILNNDSGSHFEPDVVSTFLDCLPRALLLYRGSHFPPRYADEGLRSLNREFMGIQGVKDMVGEPEFRPSAQVSF